MWELPVMAFILPSAPADAQGMHIKCNGILAKVVQISSQR
jgi:hypothetical protein